MLTLVHVPFCCTYRVFMWSHSCSRTEKWQHSFLQSPLTHWGKGQGLLFADAFFAKSACPQTKTSVPSHHQILISFGWATRVCTITRITARSCLCGHQAKWNGLSFFAMTHLCVSASQEDA